MLILTKSSCLNQLKCEFFEIFACVDTDWHVCEGDAGATLPLKTPPPDTSYRVLDILGGVGGFLLNE